MARYLLDSDAVIDYLAGIAGTVELIHHLHRQGEDLCVCDVVIADVYSGLRIPSRDAAQKLIGSLSFLPTSAEAARRAGEWRYAYARRGVTLSTTDVLVAATASAHQAGLVTGNRDHYPMRELQVLPLPRSTTAT